MQSEFGIPLIYRLVFRSGWECLKFWVGTIKFKLLWRSIKAEEFHFKHADDDVASVLAFNATLFQNV